MDRNDEVNEKIERLVRLLDVEQAEGVLIASRPNFAWLTAGGSNTLTATADWPTIPVTINGTEYLSPDVLSR